jgi:hypothetical protein
MKHIKAQIVLASIFLVLSVAGTNQAVAQNNKTAKYNYKTAVGLKFFPLGVSGKTFTNRKNAVELLGYFYDGFRLTALYEYYVTLNEEGNLKFYFGGGGHLGFANKENGGNAKLGLDGIVGLDYKLPTAPINISLDWQPSIGFGDNSSFIGNWGGVGVRFCF